MKQKNSATEVGRKAKPEDGDAVVFNCPVRCGAEMLHPRICTLRFDFYSVVPHERKKSTNTEEAAFRQELKS